MSEAAIPALAWEQNYRELVPKKATKDLAVPTVVDGIFLPKDHPLKFSATNSAVMTDATGAVTGRYDKHHLLMSASTAARRALPALPWAQPQLRNFMAGKTIEALPLGDHRLALSICYEDILPGYFNDVVRATDPDLLLNITNDAWFLDTTEPWIHFALAKLRSVEQRRYLVRATNSGLSGIVDATGAVVVHGGTFVAEDIVGEARYMHGRTVYRVLGDKPWWALAAVMLALCFLRRPEPTTSPA
ncbi:MAG: apolipoprotein N-acyltransferase [Polyangiaceae bacterium]